MKRWIIALLFCVPGAALANSPCDKPVNDFDGIYCLSKIYQEADKELNDNYSKLSGQLDSDGEKSLKAGQLAWIRERAPSTRATGFMLISTTPLTPLSTVPGFFKIG